MMLNRNEPMKYMSSDYHRLERLKDTLTTLKTKETVDLAQTANMLETLFGYWMEHADQPNWNHIVDGIKRLPGTEEEKKIFAMGYLARVFLTEILSDS